MAETEFCAGVVSALLDKFVEPIVKGLASVAKGEWEKFKIDFDVAFIKYLKNTKDKYSKIKTILYKTEPKYIYDFFECPYLAKGRDAPFKGDNVNVVLDLSNFIIVQGTGGIGKSTFLKHLFLNEISQKDLIPIFVELKDINSLPEEYEITDFIFQRLYDLGSTIDKQYLDYALKSGCFLFLLDGYDEILSEKQDPFFAKLESFCDRYSKNYFVLSSRPYSDFVEFQRFSVLTLCDLTKEQAKSLIQKIEYDEDVKTRFMKALEDRLYDQHQSFASNPLLLNIMLLTFDNYAEIPQKLHLFYSNAFDTLYFKHDATKAGFHRELKSKLSADSFKRVFSYFCFITYYQGKIEFTRDDVMTVFKKVRKSTESFDIDDYIYDLVNSICVLYKEGLNYKFTHRSFQEYFTAIFLKELSDSDMQKMSVQLIKKDTFRIAHDSVLSMLRDMAPQRYEQNVLLPLLAEVEESCDEADKYDFYFRGRSPKLIFRARSKSGCTRYSLYIYSNRDMSLFEFLFNAARDYMESGLRFKAGPDPAAEKLFEFMSEHRGLARRDEFSAVDYMEDDQVYPLIKATWVGATIRTLADLRTRLEKKQQEVELDLTGLLLMD